MQINSERRTELNPEVFLADLTCSLQNESETPLTFMDACLNLCLSLKGQRSPGFEKLRGRLPLMSFKIYVTVHGPQVNSIAVLRHGGLQ